MYTVDTIFRVSEGEEDPSKCIAERIYDMEDETIKLKFHREKDRILRYTGIDECIYNIYIYISIYICIRILHIQY